MALIKCPECGKEISDRAEACPNCAYPIAKIKESNVVEHNEATETETQQNKEVSTKIKINNESDNKMSLEEELRIREERRRKRREAALIKKRKARRRKIIIISCIAVALIAILAFLIIKPQNQKIPGSSASYVPTEEATSTPQPTEEATQIPEPMPEPTEKTIEVEDDIVVTFDDFKKILNDKKVSYSLDFDKVFMLMEAEDGFSFKCDDGRIEKISIFGNTDKNENLTSIKIVCGGVIVDWIEGKKEIEDFHERYMKADFMSMDSVQLSAFSGTYDAIRMLGIVYELITSQYTDGFDAAIVLLTTDNPVQIGKWSVSTVADKDNYTVTIEAKYNK